MSIQPIVENCFKHGYGGKEKFKVNISIYAREGDIVIQVEDDGVGFDPAIVRKNSGIGLSNIEKRLKLQYGLEKEYLFMESQPGFTKITLKIPIKEDAQ